MTMVKAMLRSRSSLKVTVIGLLLHRRATSARGIGAALDAHFGVGLWHLRVAPHRITFQVAGRRPGRWQGSSANAKGTTDRA